jgi:hypothetical protein
MTADLFGVAAAVSAAKDSEEGGQEDETDRHAGNPFFAISSICSQNRSSSLNVVYKFGVIRMP